HNLKQFRKIIGSKPLLMPAVKGNAYGHGIVEVAKICDQNREVDKICVVDLNEALQLIKAKIKKSILILSFYENDEHKLCSAVKAGAIFPVYNIEQAILLNKIGEGVGRKAVVHIKLDAGTSRIGVLPNTIVDFIKKIIPLKHLTVEGLFSHYASSEDDKLFTENQLRIFVKTISNLKTNGINVPIQHLTCSAASILYPDSHFNAVRIGIGMYGLYPNELARKKIKLRPALSWHTTVMQVKTVPAWTKISYGGTFTTKRATKLAVLPVGYWDGYDRTMSNRAQVLIRGKKCPVRGRICMNMCMVDVTTVKNVRAGDIATLIGTQNRQSLSVEDLAKWADTINYEIVDRINPLLPRVVV
ncbi:MAG: alanine racemase, partial [Candidatus Magasanikbacteria bacterium RIFOXYA2_FULL_44_8]